MRFLQRFSKCNGGRNGLFYETSNARCGVTQTAQRVVWSKPFKNATIGIYAAGCPDLYNVSFRGNCSVGPDGTLAVVCRLSGGGRNEAGKVDKF